MRCCWLIAVIAACGGDTPGPTPEDFALAADGLASIDAEASLVAAIELSLSGDFAIPPPLTDDEPHDVTLGRIAKESVVFARAALGDCLTTADPVDDVVTHTLIDCSIEGRSVSGSVVSRFSLVDAVHVAHASDDLQIDGRAIRLVSTVEGFLAGETETRRRTLNLEVDGGQTIVGSWVAILDGTGCGSKDGTATASLADAVLERVDTGLAWCGDGGTDTLTAGVVGLARGGAAVDLVFLGSDRVVLDGDDYTVDSTISELRD